MEVEFFTRAAILAGLAVTVVQQILKLRFVPISFANRYPVPTNIILSIVGALVAVWTDEQPQPSSWVGWAGLVAVIAVVAAITYNNLLRNWPELKATEGEG